MPANREYKSSVFSLLFNEKEKLLELYNAIEGTDYGMDTEIKMTTLEKALYMEWYNDISFTIDGKYVVLLEHQSTICYNLPLRASIYINRVYEKLIDKKTIYKKEMIRIPSPEFYVLYNGTESFPKEEVMRLSDAFSETGGMMELEVRVININYDEAPELLDKSQTLNGYSYFVSRVRKHLKDDATLEEAIELAMKECIEKGILKEFLEDNGSEVKNMLYTEFNMEDALQVREEETEYRVKKQLAFNILDLADDSIIAEKIGLSLEDVKDLRENGLKKR